MNFFECDWESEKIYMFKCANIKIRYDRSKKRFFTKIAHECVDWIESDYPMRTFIEAEYIEYIPPKKKVKYYLEISNYTVRGVNLETGKDCGPLPFQNDTYVPLYIDSDKKRIFFEVEHD